MYIKEIKEQDIGFYQRVASDSGTLFDSADLLSIYGDKVRIYAFCEDNGIIIGGFHLYHGKKFGFSVLGNAPFSPSAGPFFKMKNTRRGAANSTWKKLLSLMADFLDKLPCSVISLTLSKFVIDTQPFIWKKFKVVPHYTYILDLKEPLQTLWDGFSGQHRNHITKAQKDGLEARQINAPEVIKGLVMKTFSRQSKKINTAYIDKLLSFLGSGNSYAFAAYKNETPISASLFIHDSSTDYLLLSGYDHDNKHHGAGALVVWEGIKKAKELGLMHFDFEGSMLPPVEKFFRDFGGELVPYYRINKAKLPLEMALKFYKRELF